ncbi:MAG: glycosyltransferase family 4 protein [Verrucomicrobia bacterium]|nr:glycosyltransferase family 4 protein [Verrucomicrobiota bacterium]
MKILLINDYGVPQGGAEIMALRLRTLLRERGHDARLFASNAGGPGGICQADYTCLGTTSRFRTLLQTANPWAWRQLRRVLADFRPDVVHVKMFLTQLSPLILPLLRRVPSLYDVLWHRPICPLGTKLLPDRTVCASPPSAVCYQRGCLPLRDWLPLMVQMKFWRRWRDVFGLIVANSEAVRRRLVAEGIEPVEVVLSGVPTNPPRPPLASPPTVMFAGRLVREKGVDVLLRAYAKLTRQIPEVRLVIYGDGPERGRIENLGAELRIMDNISMPGFRPHDELAQAYSGAWALTVPSLWEEPFGVVATEAMMAGTAVVASRSGGLAEIVRDGETGYLVPPGDTDALAAALLRLLQDRALAERMGRAGRDLALAEFNESRMVDRFVQLYESLRRNRPETHEQ